MEEQVTRARMPRGTEMIGEIVGVLGASRFKVNCTDGKERLCRIPGKFRKRINVRLGYLVIVKPWEIEPDEKGDIIWIYNKTHSNWLRKKGYVK